MDGAFGYNLPGDMGAVLGSLYVGELVDRLTNATGAAQEVYLEFGHDTTIDMALTGLGLAKDTPTLSAKGPVRSNRKFRTSYQVPFAAQMLWEKFSCTSSFDGPQVRLVLNDAPFPLSTCALALLLEEERLVELFPDADGFVVRAGDDELAVVADGKRPDFAVVTLELLNVFELETPR